MDGSEHAARGQVAQLVERSPEKAGVGGSIPSLATMFSITYNHQNSRLGSNWFQFRLTGIVSHPRIGSVPLGQGVGIHRCGSPGGPGDGFTGGVPELFGVKKPETFSSAPLLSGDREYFPRAQGRLGSF